MVYEHKPIRPRKNLAPRFTTYYPLSKENRTISTKLATLFIRTGVYFLLLFTCFLFLYCIPIRPKIISRFTSFSRLASELPPPTPPTIHYLSPPSELAKDLAYCATLCQAQEWQENQYLKPQTLERTVEEAFGKKVNYEESYPEDWPFLVRNTDQFALNSIISLRMSHLSQSQNSSSTSLSSADYIYIALDTRAIARCFGGCRNLPTILENGLDRKAFKIETVDWLLETVVSLRHRRNYPSIILALSLIDHDYEYNILSEKSQDVMRDDLITLGIERNPWTTKDSLKWFEQVPYPSTLHLPFYNSVEMEKEGRRKLADWTKSREKTFLLSFAGRSQPILNNSGKGVLNGFGIRTLLANQLALSTAPDLHLHYFTSSSPRTSNSLALIHTAMSKSKFCLQPAGDSPTRRGVYESILLGCIPVLFRKGGYKTWTESFGGKGIGGRELGGIRIEEDLAIFVDEEIMLENDSLGSVGNTNLDGGSGGKVKDIVSILREWNPKEIKRIQGNMREVAGWMQFSMPVEGKEGWLKEGGTGGKWSEDAFGMLLRRLSRVREESR